MFEIRKHCNNLIRMSESCNQRADGIVTSKVIKKVQFVKDS